MTNEELVTAIQQGVDVDKNKAALYEQMKRLIYFIAKTYTNYRDKDDLVQEGYFGLMQAVDKYDPDKGAPFASIAAFYIKNHMKHYIDMNGSCVAIPSYVTATYVKYRRVQERLKQQLDREPTDEEIGSLMGISSDKVELIRENQIKQNSASLNTSLADDTTMELLDTIPAQCNIEDEVCDRLQQEQLKTVLWSCVDELPERESRAVREHYQLGVTYADIGAVLGVSNARVGQLMEQAIKHLRCKKILEKLAPFIDDIRSNALQGVGVGAYKRSCTSATERVVIQRERYNELMADVTQEMARLMRTKNVPRS